MGAHAVPKSTGKSTSGFYRRIYGSIVLGFSDYFSLKQFETPRLSKSGLFQLANRTLQIASIRSAGPPAFHSAVDGTMISLSFLHNNFLELLGQQKAALFDCLWLL